MAGKSPIIITERAAAKIKDLLAKRNKESFGIRVGVKSGGCSGLSYYIEYADSKNPYDEVACGEGFLVLIDPKALMYLLGTSMDYLEDPFKSGFVFNNPNEKSRCGCGKSFKA